MLQQHEIPDLPSIELMTAAAHPTPAFTFNACEGQLRAQAPHSMQASRASIRTRLPFILKTA
jgi:hypothetical protein